MTLEVVALFLKLVSTISFCEALLPNLSMRCKITNCYIVRLILFFLKLLSMSQIFFKVKSKYKPKSSFLTF